MTTVVLTRNLLHGAPLSSQTDCTIFPFLKPLLCSQCTKPQTANVLAAQRDMSQRTAITTAGVSVRYVWGV